MGSPRASAPQSGTKPLKTGAKTAEEKGGTLTAEKIRKKIGVGNQTVKMREL